MNAYDEIGWEEVEVAAANIFNLSYVKSELEWAKEAWEHFGKAGLNQASGAMGHTAASLRLLTLGRIYREFCLVARDEHTEDSLTELSEQLYIDQVALGVLASANDRMGLWDELSEADILEAALELATDEMRGEIFDCLMSACGNETMLYSWMWQASCSVHKTAQSEIDGRALEVTANKQRAFLYVTNGFSL